MTKKNLFLSLLLSITIGILPNKIFAAKYWSNCNWKITTPFPENFLWGAGTSHHQIEETIPGYMNNFDLLCNLQIFDRKLHPTIKNPRGRACMGWEKALDDVSLVEKIAQNKPFIYRMSVSWEKIMPDDSGVPNQEALDHYKNLLKKI